MDEQTTEPTNHQPGRLALILITQAYNRGEISYDEWLTRTREWAEAVIARYSAPSPKAPVKRGVKD